LFLDKLPKAEDCEVQNIITHIFFIIITPLWETAGIQISQEEIQSEIERSYEVKEYDS